MRVFRHLPWLLFILLGLLSCASQMPRYTRVPLPAESKPVSPPSPSRSETSEAAPPTQPVVENHTFVTVDGVPRYKIGPGDILEVLLQKGILQERQTVAVKANGLVIIDFLEVRVGGLTLEQAAGEIRRILAPYYKQINAEVAVKEYHSKKVTLMGAGAGKVGAFPLKGRTTLLDLIADVGGPSASANLDQVRVLRADSAVLTVNISRLLAQETLMQDVVLDTGDVVFIPARGPADERNVFVLGEVRNPGPRPFVPDMRLSQALALSGGPTELAVLQSARVIRVNSGNAQMLEVDFRKVLEQGDRTQDVFLQVNDLIVVPRSGIGNWNAMLAKLRPTLEFVTLPLQPLVTFILLRDAFSRRE